MESLPIELLGEILGLLANHHDVEDKAALCNLRLTSKHFTNPVAPLLFASIPLWISLKSLERLGALSTHPVISPCVREIRFSALSICDEPLKDSVNEDLEDEMNDLDEEQHREEGRLRHLVGLGMKHKAYSTAKTMLYSHCVADSLLRRAFLRLTNVKSVNISITSASIGAREMRKDFGIVQHEEYEFDPSENVTRFVDALWDASPQLGSFRFSQTDKDDRVYHDLDLARLSNYKNRSPALLNASRQFSWNGLRVLELDFFDLNPNVAQTTEWDSFTLATERILSATTGLRNLILGGSSSTAMGSTFMSMLSKVNLKHLERVILSNIEMSKPGLLTAFIGTHSSTLCSFEFYIPWRLHGEEQLLQQWSRFSYPKLKKFVITLRNILERIDAAPFLTGKVGDNPLRTCVELQDIKNAPDDWEFDSDSDPDDQTYTSEQQARESDDETEFEEEYDSSYNSDDSLEILEIRECQVVAMEE